jgi:hypothetical protein
MACGNRQRRKTVSEKASVAWVYAKCPYFRDESAKRQRIVCSGCEPGQTMHLFFRSEKKRQAWMETNCCSWQFGKCPFHRAIAEAEEEREARG